MGSTYDTLQLLKNILPNLDANVFSNWASRDHRDQQFIEGVKQVLPDNVKCGWYQF